MIILITCMVSLAVICMCCFFIFGKVKKEDNATNYKETTITDEIIEAECELRKCGLNGPSTACYVVNEVWWFDKIGCDQKCIGYGIAKNRDASIARQTALKQAQEFLKNKNNGLCLWKKGDRKKWKYGIWLTECGDYTYRFLPSGTRCLYCPSCGRPIKEVKEEK